MSVPTRLELGGDEVVLDAPLPQERDVLVGDDGRGGGGEVVLARPRPCRATLYLPLMRDVSLSTSTLATSPASHPLAEGGVVDLVGVGAGDGRGGEQGEQGDADQDPHQGPGPGGTGDRAGPDPGGRSFCAPRGIGQPFGSRPVDRALLVAPFGRGRRGSRRQWYAPGAPTWSHHPRPDPRRAGYVAGMHRPRLCAAAGLRGSGHRHAQLPVRHQHGLARRPRPQGTQPPSTSAAATPTAWPPPKGWTGHDRRAASPSRAAGAPHVDAGRRRPGPGLLRTRRPGSRPLGLGSAGRPPSAVLERQPSRPHRPGSRRRPERRPTPSSPAPPVPRWGLATSPGRVVGATRCRACWPRRGSGVSGDEELSIGGKAFSQIGLWIGLVGSRGAGQPAQGLRQPGHRLRLPRSGGPTWRLGAAGAGRRPGGDRPRGGPPAAAPPRRPRGLAAR